MGGFHSKPSSPPKPKHVAPKEVSSHDRAVLDLKVQRDKLKQYAKRVSHLKLFFLPLSLQIKKSLSLQIKKFKLKEFKR